MSVGLKLHKQMNKTSVFLFPASGSRQSILEGQEDGMQYINKCILRIELPIWPIWAVSGGCYIAIIPRKKEKNSFR